MRIFHRLCLLSTMLATLLVSSALAQPPRGERPGRGDGPPPREDRGDRGRGPGGPGGFRGGPPPEVLMRMVPVLAALDADQDGKISKEEIENATAALKKLDKNNDGDLTAEEMRPNFPAFGGRGGPPGGRGFGPPEGRRGPEGRGRPEGEARGPRGPEDRGPGGPEGRRRGGPGGDPTAIVDRWMQLDENDDGKVSKEEAGERWQGMFARADANEDGFATREELRAMAPRGNPGQFLARMFEQRDENKDGKLSGDEIPEQMAQRLEQIDTDKDGSVSRKELEGSMSRMRERFGPGRGRGEGGGRPGGDRPRRPEPEEE